MHKETIDIADPDDVAAARTQAAAVAAARATLARHQARRAQIEAALASQAATYAKAALTVAQNAVATAQGHLDAANGAKVTAEGVAAFYTANNIPQAQARVDAATKAVGDELARLLTQATTSAALTATIDGLALRQRYRTAVEHTPPLWDMATIPLRQHHTDKPADPQIHLPALDDDDYPPLLTVLARHDERVDSVADLIAAEALHHLVNGNPVRAGAALDVAASGTVPDDLDVIVTPRRGHDISHRVFILTDASPTPAWNSPSPCLPAQVDLITTAWVSTLLPDPADVTFVVSRLDPDTGVASGDATLTADRLGLDPLAWLRVAADRGEMLARIAVVARATWATTLGDAAKTGRVQVSDPFPPDPTRLTLTDLVTAAAAAGRALRTARALTAADLLEPTTPTPDVPSATANAAIASAQTAAAHVDEVLADLQAITPDTHTAQVLSALLAAAALGVSEATPPLQDGMPTPATLHTQVAATIARLTPRSQLPPLTAAATGDATLALVRERLASLCGVTVALPVVLPVPVDPSTRADLDETPRAGAEPSEVRAWLYDHAPVRPSVAALADCVELAEALGCAARLDVRATQLPRGSAPWIGTDPAPPPGATSLIVLRCYPGTLPDAVTGLAVDAWVQTVPAVDHDTAVAFHYDEPNGLPPQAILIGAAPDVTPARAPGTWDLDTLLDVVTSTMALAQDRAVAAELLDGAGVTVPDPSAPS